MANISQTYSGDLTTSIASKIFDIISDARVEKSKAQEEADKYGVDVNFTPGEFTARSARNDLIRNTLGSNFVPKTKYPDLLARGQSTADPLMGTPVNVRKLPEYQQLASEEEKKFRSRSKAVPSRKPSTSSPSSSSRKPESTTSDPIKVQDKKLGVFLEAVAKSLNSNIASINSKINETESNVIQAKEGIFGTIKQLEQNSDLLETKLDAIIDALREQNTNAQKSEDNAQSQKREGELEKESDLSSVERIIDPGEKQSDIVQLNLLDDIRNLESQCERLVNDFKGVRADLKNKLIDKLFVLVNGKTSQGVTNSLREDLIPKGTKFTQKLLQVLDYTIVNPNKWTTDKDKNDLIKILINNFNIHYFPEEKTYFF